MDSGFGLFRECLKYKLERQGKAYIAVGRYAPTAKTCHACGAVVSREVNGARNLRDMVLAQFWEQRKARLDAAL